MRKQNEKPSSVPSKRETPGRPGGGLTSCLCCSHERCWFVQLKMPGQAGDGPARENHPLARGVETSAPGWPVSEAY